MTRATAQAYCAWANIPKRLGVLWALGRHLAVGFSIISGLKGLFVYYLSGPDADLVPLVSL